MSSPIIKIHSDVMVFRHASSDVTNSEVSESDVPQVAARNEDAEAQLENIFKKAIATRDPDRALRVVRSGVAEMLRQNNPDADVCPHEHTDYCFNHPIDPTKVITFTHSGIVGRHVIYEWGNLTNNQLLPRLYKTYHGHDEDDGVSFAFLIVEKLNSKNKRSSNESHPKGSVNYYQSAVLRVCESMSDRSNDTYYAALSSYANFLHNVRRRVNEKHKDQPSSWPRELDMKTVIRLNSWLRDLYDLLVMVKKIGNRRFYSSEIFARGKSLVLINPSSGLSTEFKTHNQSTTNTQYSLASRFEVNPSKVDPVPHNAMVFGVPYGSVDVTFKVTSPVIVNKPRNIYSFFIQPIEL